MMAVNVGDDVTCLCEGKGGKPPANVTWYKDGVQIGDTEKEDIALTLRNVDKKDGGTYNCVANSYTLANERSINLIFYGKYDL